MRTRLRSSVPVLLALLASTALWADPPSRVARLNYSSGSVSFRPSSVDDWAPAESNYPLTTGDHLWTDRGSRGEIHVGSTVMRLGPETAFAILNLDDQVAQVRVSAGALNVRVGAIDEDEVVEVDTPGAAISLLRPGTYRIDVSDDGEETIVTVRHGEAEVTAGGSAVPVRSGDSAYFTGTDSPSYDVREARRPDEWDDWCEDRDRREERAGSRRYVSPEVVGYEDLDDYGTWRDEPEYGSVWVPTHVDTGWAPYREGHWAWVQPWGWTWVDDEPWGFAPFHYGRWVYHRGVWCWVPGSIRTRPVYAPALVVFLGGGGWDASLTIRDGVAWFPLGPHEVYVPPYAVSPVYLRHINVPHVDITRLDPTVITVGNANAIYVNRRVVGAVTAVPGETFVTARPVRREAVTVPAQLVATAPVGTLERVKPRVDSIVGAPGAHLRAPRPPARLMERPVVARVTPPPAPRHFGEPGTPEGARVRPNPLVRPAIPAPGEEPAHKLRPKREGLPPAEPVTVTPRTGGPGGKLGEGADRKGRPNDDDRPSERRTHERVPPEPTPRPTARPDFERPPRPEATPRPESTPRPEVTPRPTPRPEPDSERERERFREPRPTPRPEATPRPTPTPEPEFKREPRPTPRPDRPERDVERERPTPRPEPEVKREPRPTPEPEVKRERERERERPTPRPEPTEKPKGKPKPTPTPTPTPK